MTLISKKCKIRLFFLRFFAVFYGRILDFSTLEWYNVASILYIYARIHYTLFDV